MMVPKVPISRPTPPRAEDYAVVPASQGPRRDFRISVGPREGWDAEGRVFDVYGAVRTARAWTKRPRKGKQRLRPRPAAPVRGRRGGEIGEKNAPRVSTTQLCANPTNHPDKT